MQTYFSKPILGNKHEVTQAYPPWIQATQHRDILKIHGGPFRQAPHSTLEPHLGQIQIAKAATYAERCAKISTLRKIRNAWFERYFGESRIFLKALYIFFFSISPEKV